MARKNLIAKISLVLTFLASFFFFWFHLQGQTNTSQPPGTPTVVLKAGLKLNIPSKALWKNYVFVSAETDPETNCRLTYVPPAGEVQVMDVTADTSGLCEWRWRVEEAQGKGSGRLIFTINGVSETHFIEIRSSF